MRFPYLRCFDTETCTVSVTDGLSETGVPASVVVYSGKCAFDEKAKTIRSSDGQLVQLLGTVTIKGDIAPEAKVITGDVTVNSRTWKIYTSTRPTNPDGTVNHTCLELM